MSVSAKTKFLDSGQGVWLALIVGVEVWSALFEYFHNRRNVVEGQNLDLSLSVCWRTDLSKNSEAFCPLCRCFFLGQAREISDSLRQNQNSSISVAF